MNIALSAASRRLQSYRLAKLICALLTVGLFGGSMSSKAQLPPPPGMIFSCSPNPLYMNVSATCTAHVGGGATGRVALSIGGTVYANPALDSNGNAIIATGPLNPPPGLLVINANYSGDSNYAPAQATGVVSVYNAGIVVTAETLSCSPYILFSSAANVSTPATCTVHIPGGATGQVTFTVDGNAWTTVSVDTSTGNAVATQGLLGLPQGTHTVQAVYSGDNNFQGFATTTSMTISGTQMQPKTTTVGCTPALLAPGATGSCTVRVTGGATGTAALYVNNQQVGKATLDATGNATIANLFGTLPAGSYAVQAFYSGDSNFSKATTGTTVSVGNGTSTPTMTVSCSPSALTLGQLSACTAHLPKGATGSVSFTTDGVAWNTAPIDSYGRASVSGGLSGASLGTHSVMAAYGSDPNFKAQSATATIQVANQTVAPPSISIKCTPVAVVLPNNANCYASVGGGATGSVVLYLNGNQDGGQGLDANGHALFQHVLWGYALGVTGPAQITASYLGDLNFSPATASTSVQLVSQPINPTITASLSPATIQNDGSVTTTMHVSSGATGTVAVTLNGQPFETLELDRLGNATSSATFSGASAGATYTFSFAYSGDGNFNPVSTAATLTISPDAPVDPTPPPTAPALGKTLYSYSILQPGGSTGYAPNGNITAFTDSVNGQWTAGYDSLNRLTAASQIPTPTTGQNVPAAQYFCWNYDSFGNRTLQARAPSALSQCATNAVAGENVVSATYDGSNHLTAVSGEGYAAGATGSWQVTQDLAGNTTQDAANRYVYDGEGRMCAEMHQPASNWVGYLYDAEGHRVAKGSINVPDGTFDPCDMSANGFRMTTEYIPGPNGEQLTEVDWSTGNPNWAHTNAFAGGQLVATYTSDNKGGSNLHFQLADWLGTRRLQTDYAGNPEETCSGGTFGDALNCVPTGIAADATELHFTGKERDSESGLDYFGARYYGSNMGRMMSPDPLPWAFWQNGNRYDQYRFQDYISNPQNFNMYAYVLNNPLSYTDPSGMTCQTNSSDGNTYDDMDGKGCATVDQQDADRLKNGQYDATVHGGSNAAQLEVNDAVGSFLGNGPKNIEYQPNDPFTLSFQRSAGMDAINAKITANCSASSGKLGVGSGEAFVNTLIDGIAGGEGFHTPEAQLGAFNATYSHDGFTATVTVTNPISLNSAAYHATSAVGIQNPKSGPLGTVHQTLHINEPDPCNGHT